MITSSENIIALIVLGVLVISFITSMVILLMDNPVSMKKGWYPAIIPVIALLGIPGGIDLLRTTGPTIAWAIAANLILLVTIVFPVLILTDKLPPAFKENWDRWAIPVLVTGGLVVSGYLTFVESTGGEVQCGPVMHGCGSVQDSPYAILFGILPISVLGLAGNLALLAAWLVWYFGPEKTQKLSGLAIWGMSLFGVLFSTYLTYLEPFAIGATCMWCITSAILMILLLWVSTPTAQSLLAIKDED